MHVDPMPSCFKGHAAPPVSTAAGPTTTTSIYETHLGLAALTWSRTVLGLSLRAELRLPSTSSSYYGINDASSSASSSDCSFASFHFRVLPWLLWKRRGTKRFHIKEHNRTVDFAWDLSRATFSVAGGPEPNVGFFVAISVDGEMFLIVGDREEDDVYKKTKTKKAISGNPSSRKGSVLVSRREYVSLPDSGVGRLYRTRAKISGKDREITIDLAGGGGGGGGEKDVRMCVKLDGKRVLQVKRLRWKFRGNERVEVDGGARVQVSWDIHNWLFPMDKDEQISAAAAAATSLKNGQAVFVFRFDRDGVEEEEGHSGKRSGGWLWGLYGSGYFGSGDWSSSSSIGGGGGGGGWKREKKKGSLVKTRSLSSASTSSASSRSSSSVMEWASAEENELVESDEFSLVVYVSKQR